jgi:hypothetical protein
MKTEEQKQQQIPEVEPPPGLANRTCARIWATLDAEEQESGIHSGTFMNSAFYSPESMLPPSFLLQTSEPEKTEPALEKTIGARTSRFANIVDEEGDPPRPSRVGLIASISVGIIIAFLLFPMIRYAEQSTRSHIAEGLTSEISRRIGQYEQIHGALIAAPTAQPVAVEILPYNLALSGWQEVVLPLSQGETVACSCSVMNSVMNRENGSEPKLFSTSTSELEIPVLRATAEPPFATHISATHTIVADPDALIPLDVNVLSNHTLLVIPGQDLVRSAFGQAILFKDGRIFSRVLPSAEPKRSP